MKREEQDFGERLHQINFRFDVLFKTLESELTHGSATERTMAALSEAYSSLHQLYDEITEIAEDALIEGHRHFNAILSEERAARRQELKALIAENSALVEQGLCDYRAAQERGESAPQLMHNIIGTQHAIKNLREELLDLNGAELLEIRHDATLGGSTH